MKQLPGLFPAFRFAGVLAIVFLGLMSIISSSGDSGKGGGGYTADFEGVLYHLDADGDGYGDPNITMRSTAQPQGYVSDYTDCDDGNPAINPGAEEYPWDNIDNNCNGQINEGAPCTDIDGDGFYIEMGCGTTIDCDDTNPAIYPGAIDIYCDGVDGDCDGFVDESCYCTDRDRDGYYVESDCGAAPDCDDTRAGVYPGAMEICGNDIDNDCDGMIDERCPSVPDTGQSTCYNSQGNIIDCADQGNAFYGQDASYAVNTPSFTKLDNRGDALPVNAASWAAVRDNFTGLVWEAKSDNDDFHDKDRDYWYDSIEVLINSLNVRGWGGYTDWRLPTKQELISIVNYGNYGENSPAIDTAYFPNTMASEYWTSSKSACIPSLFWLIDFSSGIDAHGKDASFAHARAVRGKQASMSFTDNGDGTVTDQESGLMWMQATADANGDGSFSRAADDAMTWQDALYWCENSSVGGYNDWRLPTIKELHSLVDYEEMIDDPVINTAYFPDTVSSQYWSSTTAGTGYRDYAWFIDFDCGDLSRGKKPYLYYVRAVRDGQR